MNAVIEPKQDLIQIDQKSLKEILCYDPETGIFTWFHRDRCHFTSDRFYNSWNARFAGKTAGSISYSGYWRMRINRISYQSHRLAWLYITGSFPVNHIDHINGIRSDNRFINLRDVTPTGNGQNQRLPSTNNTTGFLGVSFFKESQKYKAQIMVDGNKKHIGLFPTPELAHSAYINAKRSLHPTCSI